MPAMQVPTSSDLLPPPRRRPAFFPLCLAASLVAGCATAPPEGDNDGGPEFFEFGRGPLPQGGAGGQVLPPPGGDGTGGSEPVGGAQPLGGSMGGGLSPADMGAGVDPDSGPSVPRPAALIATIVLAEQPQVPSGSAIVSVTEPSPLPNVPGCSVVRVNPNAPPQAAGKGHDAGPITVTGARSPLVFRPIGDPVGGYQYSPEVAPGSDLFDDGAQLLASSPGGSQMGPFQVMVAAPARVRIDGPTLGFGETLSNRDPVSVRWGASQSESLLITLFPAQFSVDSLEPLEGNWIFCGVPDTGSYEVPGNLIEQMAPEPDLFGQGALLLITRSRFTQTMMGTDSTVLVATTSEGAPLTFR